MENFLTGIELLFSTPMSVTLFLAALVGSCPALADGRSWPAEQEQLSFYRDIDSDVTR